MHHSGRSDLSLNAAFGDLTEASLLVSAVQRLSLSRTVEDVQAVVRTTARALTGADGATFILRDGGQCYYVDEDAIQPLWKGQRFPLERCVSGWAMLHGKAAVIPDIYADERVPHEAYRPTFVRSMCMVPIRPANPIGAIGNYWATTREVSPRDVMLLQTLADSTAVALENLRMVGELESARLETLERLARAAEYRDDETFAHTERVASRTAAIAARLGLSGEQIAVLAQAAPLHDIGKIAVSDAILLKPGPLNPEEHREMRRHVLAGAAILDGSRSEVLRVAREIVLTHHEWWNGGGYPAGLAGPTIPLSGRIVALADVFDALTHVRPYKPAWTERHAVEEISRLSGTQFDPDVVRAFRQSLGK